MVHYLAYSLILLGVTGSCLGYFTLGPVVWTPGVKVSTLVTKGIYSKISHPIYFFSTLTLIGTMLLFKNSLFLLIPICTIQVQLWRAGLENIALENKFGDTYRKYKKGVWF